MSESIWKKEIRLRKPKEPKAPKVDESKVVAVAAEPRPRGTVVVPVVPAASPAVQRLERWSRVPAPRAEFPRPAAPQQAEVPSFLAPRQKVGWEPPAELEPVAEAQPAPVPAREPEPAPVAAEKVPLLKREISFRRTPKAAKPPKEKHEKPPRGDRTPLLKRELHLPRREPKTEAGHKVTRIVGLRIGSSQLAAALMRNNGSAEVLQLGRQSLERGLVVGGEVREPVALAKALKAFFSANKLPRKDIRLGIASNRIGVRLIDVPAIGNDKQFENAIRFRAQEVLPIPVTDAVLDHVVLGEEMTEQGEVVRRILLVFAHRELVSRYVEVCKQAGLRLTGIDLDAFALLRALGGPGPVGGLPQAVVAVAVGHERTVFAVSDGGICEFTRVLEWGGSAIDVALARALNLTPSQVQPLKHRLSLDATEPPEGLSAMQLEAARAAMQSETGVLVRELVSSLRFYQSNPDSLAIGEVLLAGGASALDGFAAELERGLGAPVRIADPFANVTLARKVRRPDEAGSFAIAIGLGMEA